MADPGSNDAAAAVIAKARRLMIWTMVATFVALAVVLAVVGYRVSRLGQGMPVPAEASLQLPKGAKVLSSSFSDGRLAVTVEIGGKADILLFDARTLQPLGRIRLTPAP